eukprot:scaffold577360_cov38-Prasinocladus_malaysianus.AAC.1
MRYLAICDTDYKVAPVHHDRRSTAVFAVAGYGDNVARAKHVASIYGIAMSITRHDHIKKTASHEEKHMESKL